MSTAAAVTTDTVVTDWLSWFDSRESAELINKSNQAELFTQFDTSVSKSDCIASIVNHPETIYIHKECFGSKTVSLFHHLLSCGGTLYDSSSKSYGFIKGVGKPTASFVTPDMDVLLNVKSPTAVRVSTTNHILGAKTIDDVNSLTASARSSHRPRNFVPVPPFLLSKVQAKLMESNGDASHVLLGCIEGISDFDTLHVDDTEFDNAKTKCKDLLSWLFLVINGSDAIEAVPAMNCNSDKIVSALQHITDSCLQAKEVPQANNILAQVEQSLKRPFEVLAASSSSTSDFMEKLTQLQSQNNEKSTKSFRKIPSKYQNMILVASSVTEVTCLDYDADGVEFFKSSSCVNAQVMLNSLLESENIECSVSSAMTATLQYGSFLWKDPLSPSGFSACVLSSEDSIFRSDTLHDGMILDYATKFEMSEASISKLTKTQVLFPVDIDELIHRLRGIQILASFFFKINGFLSQGLKKVVNFVTDNKQMMKTRIFLDPKFITKFLCSIDERIYLWLKDCSLHSSVVNTNLALIDFTSLLNDVNFNRFVYNLPPSIAKISSEEKHHEIHQLKKQKRSATPVMVRNNDINADWKLRNGETWNTVFRNKSADGPMLSLQCRPCLKYHVKGVCYEDCANKVSHCTLIESDKEQTTNYIKSLRGE